MGKLEELNSSLHVENDKLRALTVTQKQSNNMLSDENSSLREKLVIQLKVQTRLEMELEKATQLTLFMEEKVYKSNKISLEVLEPQSAQTTKGCRGRDRKSPAVHRRPEVAHRCLHPSQGGFNRQEAG